jgi:VWFA-related protein
MARDGSGQQPGSSQQPTTTPPTADSHTPVLKTKANEVVLPVTVRDKKGALVTSLTKSDFTLTEEGRPQTIQSLSHDSGVPLQIGLLVETNHAMSGVLEAERKAAEKFVDTLLPAQPAQGKAADANNEAFLIHFDREVELLQDFTDSRDKLHAELDDMGATRQAQNDTQGPETTGEERGERTHGARGGNQLYDAIFLASDEVMGPKPGRKALIIFSDGVDRGSKDRLNEALDAAEKAHAIVYTVYFKGEQDKQSWENPDRGGRRGGGWPGGGGGYPGGGGGYPNGGGRRGGDRGPSDTGVDGRKIMLQIAERTGGHAYDARKREDLEPIYNLIAEDLRAQYLLTYTPDKPDNEGGFHKVALKATKEEYSVEMPEGYFAPGGENSR